MQDKWHAGVIVGLRLICGIRVRCVGEENLLKPPFVIACKHQSAFECLFFNTIFKNPVFVMKKELLKVPIFGQYTWIAGMVYIDRKAGVSAMRRIARLFGKAFANGRVAIIFPEGSRSSPGHALAYKSGIALIHAANPDVPIIPVALNSGIFWPKSGFPLHPGEIIIQFLPPIKEQMEKQALLDKLYEQIETASLLLLPPSSK
ncbi:MAG: 1-acyl-sn-glycerol-3-phosphate acyltransferase [Proteobacteria bacterium]|nr:1-acyl-sn-glycerol-3-phosphate acyltransferase [Pseudomonadota bacterium]